jgi:hypothetical protein
MRIFVISSWAGRFSLAFSLFPFSRPTREFHLDDCTNSENVTWFLAIMETKTALDHEECQGAMGTAHGQVLSGPISQNTLLE